MIYGLLADAVVLLHFGFVLFVAAGALAVYRWPRLAWLHLPAAAWGIAVAFAGWVCPLTPLENLLRRLGGQAGYEGSFIEHYIVPLLYPAMLTRRMQIILGAVALTVNAVVYAPLLIRWLRQGRSR